MVNINLLPWREYKKTYEKKALQLLIFNAVLSSIIILLPTHYWLYSQVNRHENKAAHLKEEVQLYFGAELSKIAPNYMSTAAVAYLKATQTLLRNIALNNDAVACFTTISRTANEVQFEGNTRSATDLATFLKSWQGAQVFSEIRIDELKQQPGAPLLQFRFHGYEQKTLDKEPIL